MIADPNIDSILRRYRGEEPLVRDKTDESDGRVLVARGDSFLDEGRESSLKSQLRDVSDEQWTQFVRRMATKPLRHVSDSNGLGMFELYPRRLADLGLVEKLHRGKRGARTVWLAVFVPPMTSERFLTSPTAQYGAFGRSMRDYDARLAAGEIECCPEMSRSEALAILHKVGPQGMKKWLEDERFPETEQLVHSVAGIF